MAKVVDVDQLFSGADTRAYSRYEFCEHERGHRSLFEAELRRRGELRCRSYWLCGAGGFALGMMTGFLGRGAIAATTVAVERVVLRHLEHQIDQLRLIDPTAVEAIGKIAGEERLHHDRAAACSGPDSAWQRLLSPVVSASTEAVIWLGMRA